MTIQDGYYTLVDSQWTKYEGNDTPEAPYFHYDSANHILTLNNVTIDPSNDGIGTFPSDGSTSPEIYISYSGGTFTIELIGENKIIDNPEANPRQWKRGPAIEVLCGETTITGGGSLTLSHYSATEGLLNVTLGSLIIDDVDITLRNYNSGKGIQVGSTISSINRGDCTIRNSVIDANYSDSSTKPSNIGIDIFQGGLDISDSTVNVRSNNDRAIYANDNLSISNSTVNAVSGKRGALVCGSILTIKNNSQVYASGGDKNEYSTVRGYDGINIEGSSLVAESSGKHAIETVIGSLQITNSEVTATTEASSSSVYAVYAKNKIAVNNSKLTASGTGCGAIYSKSGSLEITNNSDVEATTQSSYAAVEIYNSITVTASKLTANSKGKAITANNKTLEIKNGSEVEATSTGTAAAVYAKNGITVEGSKLTADSAGSNAINTNYGAISINSSEVEATTQSDNPALYGSNGITIDSSDLTAYSAEGNAIYSPKAIQILNNSDVTATNESTSNYPALASNYGITIYGSRVYAKSTSSAINANGGAIRITNNSEVTAISDAAVAVYAYDGDLEVSSSTVTANGAFALYSSNKATVTDSLVKATTTGKNTIYGSPVSITGSWFESYGGVVGTEATWTNSVNFRGNEGTVIGDYVLLKDNTITDGQTLKIPAETSFKVPSGLHFSNQGNIVLEGDFTKEDGAIIEPCANHVYNGGYVCLICGYIRCYDITATAGEGGSIEPSGTVAVMEGEDQTFVITPDNGYRVAEVLVDGEDVGAVTSYTFTDVKAAHTIEAIFERLTFNLPEIDSDEDEPDAEWENPFTDVSTSDWWYEAVEYVEDHGIMSGVSDTGFAPEAQLSRAMVVQILYNLQGNPAVSGQSDFSDVRGHWASEAIAWAERMGLVNGYEDYTFRPDNPVTRAELAQMLYTFADRKGFDVTASGDLSAFTDAADIPSWAEPALSWACGNGLITGYTDGSLQPSGYATRAQAATILMAFVKAFIET